MRIPALAEIQALLDAGAEDGLPAFRVAVMRNVTLEGLEPYLRYLGLRAGLALEVGFGAHDAVLQEAAGAQAGQEEGGEEIEERSHHVSTSKRGGLTTAAR